MKFADKILTAIFCAFIFSLGVLFVFMPKLTFSENEKRELSKMPDISVDSLLNGNFEAGFEKYLNDHFPFRDIFVSADAYYMLYTGRNGSNGIYKGKEGYLFAKPVKYDKTILNKNIEALNNFIDTMNIDSSIMIIPSSGFILNDKLPWNHEIYRDDEIINYIKNKVSNNTNCIDIIPEFKNAEGKIYYRTDHHYTTYGAYIAYKKYCIENELTPCENYLVESYDDFYGTSYSKSALWKEEGESLEIWRYYADIDVEINNSSYDSLWFEEHLKSKDKYPVFLNGNQPFERIINNDIKSGKILVLKDSFAHAFIPFLAQHYHQIDMVDLRYYFEPVSELAQENDYDKMLMLYGISSMCESTDISILE